MFYMLLLCVLLKILVSPVHSSFRKILDGKDTEQSMPFMVYLIESAADKPKYGGAWICGGAIVSEWVIVTSAACVEDIDFIYAIAGSKKYIREEKDIDTKGCNDNIKKKITYICVPKDYNFKKDEITKWAFIDIAVVKVESKYDFKSNDGSRRAQCKFDWVPNKIDVNYQATYQTEDTDAMVLGWGHKAKYRNIDDNTNLNEELLKYASIKIMNKATCKTEYHNVQNGALDEIIDKYMICAMKEGNFDSKGATVNPLTPPPEAEKCSVGYLRSGNQCEYQGASEPDYQTSKDVVSFDDIILNLRRSEGNESGNDRKWSYRRVAGICQNDHGGPLITWVGKKEQLIGVASVFRLDKELNCRGPFLFTSTSCNSDFLYCLINKLSEDTTTTKLIKKTGDKKNKTLNINDMCDEQSKRKGFNILRRTISWKNHPDGPAKNELLDDN